MSADTVRVMLVDDHAVVRAGYKRYLELEPALQVVDQTVSTLADKAVPVVLAELVFQVRFEDPHNFSVAEVEVAEHHPQIQMKPMDLVVQVEVASAAQAVAAQA